MLKKTYLRLIVIYLLSVIAIQIIIDDRVHLILFIVGRNVHMQFTE